MGCSGSTSNTKKPHSDVIPRYFTFAYFYRTKSFNPGGEEFFRRKYYMEKNLIGVGGSGKVFSGYLIKNPSHRVAIKVMEKAKLGRYINYIKDEVQILQKLDHPHIIKVR